MVCTVSGYLRRLDNDFYPDTIVTITAAGIEAAPDGAKLPAPLVVTTDHTGFLSFSILPGVYRMRWRENSRVTHDAPLSVPDEAAANLADLIVSPPLPVRYQISGVVVQLDAAAAEVYSCNNPGVVAIVLDTTGYAAEMWIAGVRVWIADGTPPPVAYIPPWGDDARWEDGQMWEDG